MQCTDLTVSKHSESTYLFKRNGQVCPNLGLILLIGNNKATKMMCLYVNKADNNSFEGVSR